MLPYFYLKFTALPVPYWLVIAVGSVLLLLLLVSLGRWWGRKRWQKHTARRLQQLANAQQQNSSLPTSAPPSALPAPVQRYLKTALPTGAEPITRMQHQQRGQFNLSPTGEKWRPFTATHTAYPQQPGFLWDAQVQAVPLISFRVHDWYIAGRGGLEARLQGWLRLMQAPPSAELDDGELLRFLAEAPWYPHFLKAGANVQWEANDEQSATLVYKGGPRTLRVQFFFGGDRLVERVYVAGRFRLNEQGQQEATPWEGRFFAYQSVEGWQLPTRAEVAWLLPGGKRQVYWKARISAIQIT